MPDSHTLPPLAVRELLLMTEVFRECGCRFGDYSSNEFYVPDTPEHRAAICACAQAEPDDFGWGEDEGEIICLDNEMMTYLARRCLEAVQGQPLDAGEQSLAGLLLAMLAQNERANYATADEDPECTLVLDEGNRHFLTAVLEHAGQSPAPVAAASGAFVIHMILVLDYLAQRCLGTIAPSVFPPVAALPAGSAPPLGLLTRWPSEQALIERMEAAVRLKQSYVEDLLEYSRGGNPFYRAGNKAEPCPPPLGKNVARAFKDASAAVEKSAVLAMYKGQDESLWLPRLAQAVTYDYWSKRISDETGLGSKSLSFDRYVRLLANLLYLGCIDKARDLAAYIAESYAQRRFGAMTGDFSLPLYHWLLRICFDAFGLESPQWDQSGGRAVAPDAPGECLGEPVLNTLVEHWQEGDLGPWQSHLVWLCDYYTHRTVPGEWGEFRMDLTLQRFPVCVLAWFRLRQHRGLPVPTIDHPLMTAPYVGLPDPTPLYSGGLLDRILQRLQREERPSLLGDAPWKLIVQEAP